MKDECTLKKLFDYLYPTDMTFEYHSNSKDGAFIKVILYNDLWIDVFPYSNDSYQVVKHDNNAKEKETVLYWSFKDLQEYLCMNYEG
jgi:hypothetical protein